MDREMLLRFTVKAMYVCMLPLVQVYDIAWWMEPYSHRVAQWRTTWKLGDRSWLRPTGPSRWCPPTRVLVEWIESQILVDVCSGLRPFCRNIHMIWQYFVDRMKVNAWTWSLMIYFYLHTVNADSVVNFVTRSHCRTSRVSRNTVAR